jgi:hypothetical protein
MAKRVLKNAVITVDGTNLSTHTNEVSMEDTADEVEFTGFGTNGYREFGQGLKDATITLSMFQDFDAASVHDILEPLYASGNTFVVTVKSSNAATSATNPVATMTGRLYSYSGITGAVGDALTIEATIRNAGTGITWSDV